jgi:putative addiction module component (TIGR02574 family)
MTKEQIIAEVMKLAPEERDEVAEEIRQRNAPDLTPAQLKEIHRRVEAIDRGEVEMIPGEQVMRELRERFSQRNGK